MFKGTLSLLTTIVILLAALCYLNLGDGFEAKDKTIYQVESKQIFKDYKTNAVKAKDTYENKYLKVEGYIDEIYENSIIIKPYKTSKDYSYWNIKDYVDRDTLHNLRAGGKVKATGICRGQDIASGIGGILLRFKATHISEISEENGYEK